MAEGFQLDDSEDIPLSTDTASPQPGNTQDPAGDDGEETALPAFTNTSAPDVSLSTEVPTGTFTPIAGACAYPAEWIPIALSVGNALEDVAATYNTTVDELVAGNCLPGADVQPGTLLYVPPVGMPSSTAQSSQDPTKTSTSPVATCGASASWVKYRIRSGDTLFSLAHAYGTTISQLQYANCLGSSTQIITGNDLYVPNVSQTNTPLAVSPTTAPTETETPVSPTATETETPTETPISSDTPTATETPTPEPISLSIISPADLSSHITGATVTITGDAMQGVTDISSMITWGSDLDGPLNGNAPTATFDISSLSDGTHTITASVSNAGSNASTSITITIAP